MDNKNWNQILRALSLLSQVGLIIIISGGIGFAFGYFIDYLLNFELLFKLTGLLVGLGAGFYTVYKLLISTFDD
ncbi:AtpZ/AtpI family protein [Halanaerobium hydrogeniformans]|uniref:ATP synthase protein I n=1 Tax=Halanaerobium hydrogeniformans TaxID=656519 RepID=E4RP45_HALHG|nr:AtpZ/AtpI family protein [Halanaerobium hydrogeniformans]ADQ13870.1 hypothetical protein Halsa_0395 [Halanaerobium hydrogeniformans]